MMSLIFLLSQQKGGDSSRLAEWILSILQDIGIDLYAYFGEAATLVIRKTAHVTEYTILGLAFGLALWRQEKFLLIVFLSTGLYGALDEIHQLLIPGRVGSLLDVGFDILGAGIAIGILWGILKIKKDSDEID